MLFISNSHVAGWKSTKGWTPPIFILNPECEYIYIYVRVVCISMYRYI